MNGSNWESSSFILEIMGNLDMSTLNLYQNKFEINQKPGFTFKRIQSCPSKTVDSFKKLRYFMLPF